MLMMILGKYINKIKENTALLKGIHSTNTGKIKYMFMSLGQDKITTQRMNVMNSLELSESSNRFLGNMAMFKYVEKTVSNQNHIPSEITRKLSLGYAFYHSFQTFVFPSTI
jgi:hypothetical protein